MRLSTPVSKATGPISPEVPTLRSNYLLLHLPNLFHLFPKQCSVCSWNYFPSIPLDSLGPCTAVEWGSDRCDTTISAKSRSFGRLVSNPAQGVNGGKMAHSLRSVGSAALNFAMVAQGGLDLYWCFIPHI